MAAAPNHGPRVGHPTGGIRLENGSEIHRTAARRGATVYQQERVRTTYVPKGHRVSRVTAPTPPPFLFSKQESLFVSTSNSLLFGSPPPYGGWVRRRCLPPLEPVPTPSPRSQRAPQGSQTPGRPRRPLASSSRSWASLAASSSSSRWGGGPPLALGRTGGHRLETLNPWHAPVHRLRIIFSSLY